MTALAPSSSSKGLSGSERETDSEDVDVLQPLHGKKINEEFEDYSNSDDDDDDNNNNTNNNISGGDGYEPLRQDPRSAPKQQQQQQQRSWMDTLLHKTLLPDTGFSIKGHPILEANGVATKLLKFVVWTFAMIAVVHFLVAHLFEDRDKMLRWDYIWRYESDLIVRDCVVFFVVGRLWEKPGIDNLAWMATAVMSNMYFESQNFVWFLQHSVTLFQMHCIWPWELWVFALVLIVAAGGLVAAHALKAYRDKMVASKLTEVGLCVLFFMVPMITSDYFHLHHWYAGWLMGMQFNYDVWWSRLAMAWCWGMYVNGIAVYGRDPVLTCEYAYFLTLDNRCPYISCYLEGMADVNNTSVKEMVPVDWRNCTATDDYHP